MSRELELGHVIEDLPNWSSADRRLLWEALAFMESSTSDRALRPLERALAESAVEWAVQKEQERLIAIYNRHIQCVTEMAMALNQFFRVLDAIDTATNRYRKDNLKAALNGMIGKLSGAYAELLHTCNRPDFQVDIADECAHLYKAHMQGMRNILDDEDDGAALRACAVETSEQVRLQNDMAQRVRLGRPRGIGPVQDLIGQRAYALVAKYGSKWDKIARELRREFSKEPQDELKRAALLELGTDMNRDVSDYVRQQYNAYQKAVKNISHRK